jgi:signal transduction histidine kinase
MRVSHIASQTLGFFRGTSEPAHCQLSDIVDSAISLHAGRLLVSKIKVETKYLPVASLLCREGELRQVLANLVSNSLDSMISRGQLLLRVRPATDTLSNARGIRLTIADTGSGMSPRTRRQLFEPFYTTKGSTGTGLGLWVTQQIVARHRGRIAIRSRQTEESHGTVFSLFFPYLDPMMPARLPPSQLARQQRINDNSPSATSPEDESRHTPSQFDSPSAGYNAA